MKAGNNDKFNNTAKKIPAPVAFKDAAPEVQARMLRLMGAIDDDPSSFIAVADYGKEAVETIARVKQGFATQQMRFAAIEGDFKRLAEASKGNVLKLGAAQADPLSFGPDSYAEMIFDQVSLHQELDKNDGVYRAAMNEIKTLGFKRAEAKRGLDVYIGAAAEILRRFDEEYIPEAERKWNASSNAEDERYLNAVKRRKYDFGLRVETLKGGNADGVLAARRINELMDSLFDQRENAMQVMHDSINAWRETLKQAGISFPVNPPAPSAPPAP